MKRNGKHMMKTAPVEIESVEHLQRLVYEYETVIASCCHPSADGDSARGFEELDDLTSRLCRIPLGTPAVAGLIPENVGGAGGEEGETDCQEAWWLFFRGGEMVYAARASAAPAPKLSRLAALLERSPDTLAQLARQEMVSQRQKKRGQNTTDSAVLAAAAAAAMADGEPNVNSAPSQQQQQQQQQQRRREQGAAVESGEIQAGSTGAGDEQGCHAAAAGRAVLVFVAGDRSQVGKSSTCLALLGALLRQKGLRASDLAYIKPATQCEKPQLVTDWCEANGVACRGIGPVVFYKGFTREFLKGGVGTSEGLLQEIKDAVREISVGKKVVVVDGVGYPAVGSICGVSNGDVAAALGAPVLLVGKSGVGDAVDSYNLNACFFEARGVRVLGGVFNRISTTGYYSLERCREAVTSYFAQVNPNASPYGFVPEIASLKNAAGGSSSSPAAAAGAAPSASPTTQGAASSVPMGPATARLRATAGTPNEAEALGSAEGSASGGVGEGGVEGGSARVAVDEVFAVSQQPVLQTQRAAAAAAAGDEEARHLTGQCPVIDVESEEDLEEFVAAAGSGRLVLVDFEAQWCKNCKAILPFILGLPERLDGAVAVAKADVDKAADLADARDVSTIPHFILLRDGVQVDSYNGSSEAELLSKLKEHLPTTGGSPRSSPSLVGSGVSSTDPSGATISPRTGSGDEGEGEGEGEGGGEEHVGGEGPDGTDPVALAAAEALIDAFDENVDVARLLRDIREHASAVAARRDFGRISAQTPPVPLPQVLPVPPPVAAATAAAATATATATATSPSVKQHQDRARPTGAGRRGGDGGGDASPGERAASKPAQQPTRKSREEVEAEAAKQGASGG